FHQAKDGDGWVEHDVFIFFNKKSDLVVVDTTQRGRVLRVEKEERKETRFGYFFLTSHNNIKLAKNKKNANGNNIQFSFEVQKVKDNKGISLFAFNRDTNPVIQISGLGFRAVYLLCGDVIANKTIIFFDTNAMPWYMSFATCLLTAIYYSIIKPSFYDKCCVCDSAMFLNTKHNRGIAHMFADLQNIIHINESYSFFLDRRDKEVNYKTDCTWKKDKFLVIYIGYIDIDYIDIDKGPFILLNNQC
ncbi:hypothetical protein ACJX0J_023030, partial [Zea mays]